MDLIDDVKQQLNEEYGELKDQNLYHMLMQKYGLIAAEITNTERQFLLGE